MCGPGDSASVPPEGPGLWGLADHCAEFFESPGGQLEEEVIFVVEVVVNRPLADPGRGGDLLHGEFMDATFPEEAFRGLEYQVVLVVTPGHGRLPGTELTGQYCSVAPMAVKAG